MNDDEKLRELQRRYNLVQSRLRIGEHELVLVHPRSADELISEEDFDHDDRLPYWAEIWPSAVRLAMRLAEFAPGSVGSLLELGCGAGLVTTLAAKVGFTVTATDYYAEALEFAELNARLAGCKLRSARVIDWRRLPDDLGLFDFVVAADVLYERDYTRLVAEAIAKTLKPGGQAIITDPQRLRAANFADECRRVGLSVDKRPALAVQSDQLIQTVDLYAIGW